MSAHVRGHYRIDAHGRVESMLDVNSAAIKMRQPKPEPVNQVQARAKRYAVYGLLTMLVCVGGMVALPQIERYLIAGQYARIATLRHMHGHHMHEAADRFFRGE